MASVSSRLRKVPASPIRKLAPLASQAKAKGVSVYHLNIGDPDIESPAVMVEVLSNWQTNPIGYAPSQGTDELLTAFAQYYQGLGYRFIKPEQIQITTGGSEAIFMALMATCEVGDEVLVFEPFYTNYASFAAVSGVILVPVSLDFAGGFHLPSSEAIEKAITPNTKAILICNPNNPTGTVYSREELERLVDVVKKHDLFLLSDEVYREYVFDGRESITILDYMQQLPEQMVMLDSVSKRYSLCGVRLGTLVSLNQELMAGALRMAQGRLSSGLIDQNVAATMSQVPVSYIEKVREEYQRRRDVVYDALTKIKGVQVSKSEGAFYVIAKLPVKDAEAFCAWLLTDFTDERETVMLAPAQGFYATPGRGKDEVRIAYVLEESKLKRAMEIFANALETYLRRD